MQGRNLSNFYQCAAYMQLIENRYGYRAMWSNVRNIRARLTSIQLTIKNIPVGEFVLCSILWEKGRRKNNNGAWFNIVLLITEDAVAIYRHTTRKSYLRWSWCRYSTQSNKLWQCPSHKQIRLQQVKLHGAQCLHNHHTVNSAVAVKKHGAHKPHTLHTVN